MFYLSLKGLQSLYLIQVETQLELNRTTSSPIGQTTSQVTFVPLFSSLHNPTINLS